MPSLTRSSSFNGDFSLYYASTNQNQLVWVRDSTNTLAGNDSVTFDPYSLPGWRGLIKDGNSATTSLTGVKHFADASEFSFLAKDDVFTFEGKYFGTDFRGARGSPLYFASTPPAASSSLDRANTKALSKLANKISQAQHTFSGMVALGEMRETVRMITSPAKALRKGIDQYLGSLKSRSGKIRSMPKSKALRAISDSWLEYSYGWAPLFNDVEDGVKAIRQLHNGRQPRVTVSVKADDTSNDSTPSTIASVMTGGVTLFGRKTFKSKSSVRYTAQVRVLSQDSGGTNATLGFDARSFVPTLWELIPYSFLVDYFTNVGDIINAFCNLSAGVNWVEKGTSVETECFVSIDRATFSSSGNPDARRQVLEFRPAQAAFGKVLKTRNPFTGSLVPPLQFELPNSSTKWINMAALAVSHNATIRALRK